VPGEGPGVAKLQLGLALTKLREEAGTSRLAAARFMGCTETSVGRYERGEVAPRPGDLRSLLDFYEVAGALRAKLEELGAEARQRRPKTTYGTAIPDWFRKYVNLEEGATEIRDYNGELIPGLLQIPAYAQAIISANPNHQTQDVDRLVQARQARQQRIMGVNPPQLWVILNEACLRRVVGGQDVMRAQLKHVLEAMELPHITVQVIPFSAGAHASTGFNFILLHVPDSAATNVAYLEDLTNAAQRTEPTEVAKYQKVFDCLADVALTPAASKKLIARLTREL
jgi:transcriptional regulator with XRE-family HTH domain